MNEYYAMKINEKQLALKNLVELTLNGSIMWERKDGIISADYVSSLTNHIEIDTFTEKFSHGITMTKVTITNENGKMVMNNGDMTDDTHRRLLNAINMQLKEGNVLTDFI